MRRELLLLLLTAALAGRAHAQPSQQIGESAPDYVGSVEKLQFTSITRDVAQIWVRTILPKTAKGWKQSFTGEVTGAGVSVPVHPPLTVAVQPQPQGKSEAVFAVDVKLAELKDDVLAKVGTSSVDVTIQGTLEGDEHSEAPVFAVGLLKYGSKEIEAPRGAVDDFVKLKDARLTGVTLTETSGEAHLVLFNPFSFAIPIKSVTYNLMAGERRLCGGALETLRLHPRRETEVVLPLDARNVDLIAVFGSALAAGGTIDGRLTGAITFKAGRGDVTLPINVAAKIELVR